MYGKTVMLKAIVLRIKDVEMAKIVMQKEIIF